MRAELLCWPTVGRSHCPCVKSCFCEADTSVVRGRRTKTGGTLAIYRECIGRLCSRDWKWINRECPLSGILIVPSGSRAVDRRPVSFGRRMPIAFDRHRPITVARRQCSNRRQFMVSMSPRGWLKKRRSWFASRVHTCEVVAVATA
jgi:hypothetical protein